MNISHTITLTTKQKQALDALCWNGFQNEAYAAEHTWESGLPYAFIDKRDWRNKNPYPSLIFRLVEQANSIFSHPKTS